MSNPIKDGGVIWDSVFLDPEKPFHPDLGQHTRLGVALATMLVGWATCMSGEKPPKNFGLGMLALREITGCVTMEEARKSTDVWLAERDKEGAS